MAEDFFALNISCFFLFGVSCLSLANVQTLMCCSWLPTYKPSGCPLYCAVAGYPPKSLLGAHRLPCRYAAISIYHSVYDSLESTGWSNDVSRSLVREPRTSAVLFTVSHKIHGNSKENRPNGGIPRVFKLLKITFFVYSFNKPARYWVSPLKDLDSYIPILILTRKPTILPHRLVVLAQAFMCGILNETRYHALSKKMYFPVLVIAR